MKFIIDGVEYNYAVTGSRVIENLARLNCPARIHEHDGVLVIRVPRHRLFEVRLALSYLDCMGIWHSINSFKWWEYFTVRYIRVYIGRIA